MPRQSVLRRASTSCTTTSSFILANACWETTPPLRIECWLSPPLPGSLRFQSPWRVFLFSVVFLFWKTAINRKKGRKFGASRAAEETVNSNPARGAICSSLGAGTALAAYASFGLVGDATPNFSAINSNPASFLNRTIFFSRLRKRTFCQPPLTSWCLRTNLFESV